VAGGGIAATTDSEVSLADVLLDSNSVTGTSTKGGGLYVEGGALTLDTVTLSSNEAAYGGGACLASLSDTATWTDSDFDANTASNDGAGLYMSASDAEMTDGSFTDNKAGRGGGGFYFDLSSTGSFTADSVDFSGNAPTSGNLQTISYYFGTDESFTCDSGSSGTCE
jgi:hypothetical protein